MANHPDPLPTLTEAELELIKRFNEDPAWTREKLLSNLMVHLEIAVQVELATIPIYLYTYYSINRTKTPQKDPRTDYPDIELFANEAGGRIMSVAVEEMLHLSLASNTLYAIGGNPGVYQKSPDSYPTNLPHHAALGPDGLPLEIPLAKLSFDQLWKFLEIEYPAPKDAKPEADNWETIGQVYSYIRCIICSDKLDDNDFNARRVDHQIAPGNYSPNNIDTVYPKRNFRQLEPPEARSSAARAAVFTNSPDSHAGPAQLIRVDSKHDALLAIATICDQGEGFAHTRWDDTSHHEQSHYYKFLVLQSQFVGYPESSKLPEAPKPAEVQYSDEDLCAAGVVFDFPDNPTSADYPGEQEDISNFCNGLYQYMLLLTESIFKVPSDEQKLFFNRAMHLSMIWMLDKLIQDMRKIEITGGRFKGKALAPTFENYPLGAPKDAYATLVELGEKIATTSVGWIYTTYIAAGGDGTKLPDVSEYWS